MYKTNSMNFKPYLEDYCPHNCKICKSGDSRHGGVPVNPNGFCQHYCSIESVITAAGYCGKGDKYYSGFDCRECKTSQWFEII